MRTSNLVLLGILAAAGVVHASASECGSDISCLTKVLITSDGGTDHEKLAATLDALRVQGSFAAPASETVSRLLSHRSPIYQNRDKAIVERLRTHILVTLSEIGVPESTREAILDLVAHVDPRTMPAQIGATARTIRSLGAQGREFSPHLVALLASDQSREQFSLERYSPQFRPEESTTIHLEVVRALGSVGTAQDKLVVDVLRATINRADVDPRVAREARVALAKLPTVSPDKHVAPPLYTAWRPVAQRSSTRSFTARFQNQYGQFGRLSDLTGRPMLAVFFYTRCENAGKCSMTISQLALLQRELRRTQMEKSVRLLAITLEPQHDTPQVLREFVENRGFEFNETGMAVRLEPKGHQQVLEELAAPVSFNAGWVTTHGIEASLLDERGRLVRKYSTLLWDNNQVAKDLRHVLSDR